MSHQVMHQPEFFDVYVDKGNVLLDVTVDRADPDNMQRWVIVRDNHGRVLALNLMGLDDHICVDAHAFIDGKEATVGAIGIHDGFRFALKAEDERAPKATSHGWRSSGLVALLLGNQGEGKA